MAGTKSAPTRSPDKLGMVSGDDIEGCFYFNGEVRVKLQVFINEGVLGELVLFFEDEEEVVLEKLGVHFKDIDCVPQHLFKVVFMVVQELDEALVS